MRAEADVAHERDELRRAIRTRDAFLAIVARKLEERVEALARARSVSSRREGLVELRGFVEELGLIADPDRAILLRRRRLSLTALLSRLCLARAGQCGVAVKARRGGSVIGRWDEDKLATVLGELVSNAMKYGAGHPVTIRVEVRGQLASIVVSNAGSFRGPARKPRRFYREEIRESVEGYGVGLWLVERLAKAHGGRLRFRERGGETQALVSLPFDVASGDVERFGVRIG